MLSLWFACFVQICAAQDIFLSHSQQDGPALQEAAIYGAPQTCLKYGGDECTRAILRQGWSSVKIGLRRPDSAKKWLKDTVMAISDPASKRYGEVVNRSEVTLNAGASAASVSSVNSWLQATVVQSTWMSSGDWVVADGSPESLTRLFPLPSHILSVIDHIHFASSTSSGLSSDGDRDKQRSRSLEHAQAEIKVTPSTIWNYLDIDVKRFENDPQAAAAIAVASPYDQPLNQEKVVNFVSKYGVGNPSKIDWTKPCLGVGGPEAVLDVEMAMAAAPNATHQFFCGPPKHSQQFCQAILDYLTWAYEEESAPKVHTFSYTVNTVFGVPQACREKLDEELQKLATQRVSTFWASGDSGVGHEYPAASPWGTAVGGVVLKDATANASVAAWSGSGGGFVGKDEVAPPYQNSSVAHYISTAKPRKATSGRGFPDLAAFSTHICTDESCGSAGTSAATPMVAAAFGLLNGARATAGKSPLGFVNPLLYQHPEAFRDVTEGKGNGYPVAQGWDPVTGLGIPQISKLLDIVLKLP